MCRKALTQKNTLLKNAQANAKSIFFKRVFFSPTQENFLPTLLFLIKLFSPTHGFTANSTRHRYECKWLREQFRADIGEHCLGQKRTASANMGYTTMRGSVLRMKVLCKIEQLCFVLKFSGNNPALRVAPIRCASL